MVAALVLADLYGHLMTVLFHCVHHELSDMELLQLSMELGRGVHAVHTCQKAQDNVIRKTKMGNVEVTFLMHHSSFSPPPSLPSYLRPLSFPSFPSSLAL